MFITCKIEDIAYSANTRNGIDLSLSFGPNGDNPNAFQIPPAEISPIQVGDFTGSVAAGSGANCDTIAFCAHGNGTHTECIGHITKEHDSVNQLIKSYFLSAQLITLPISVVNSNRLISPLALNGIELKNTEAIIIRSLPNTLDKRNQSWSADNPPFIDPGTIKILRDFGYKHLLTDLPSVDPEEDEGALVAHHVWWNEPENPRTDVSITELIYVPDEVPDGLYILNLQFPAIESDASPSRPLIFPLVVVL